MNFQWNRRTTGRGSPGQAAHALALLLLASLLGLPHTCHAQIGGMNQPLVLGAGEKGDTIVDPSRLAVAKPGGRSRFKFTLTCEDAERHSPKLKDSGEYNLVGVC